MSPMLRAPEEGREALKVALGPALDPREPLDVADTARDHLTGEDADAHGHQRQPFRL